MPTSAESYRRPFLRPNPRPHPHPRLTVTLKLSSNPAVSFTRALSLTQTPTFALALAPTLTLALALALQPRPRPHILPRTRPPPRFVHRRPSSIVTQIPRQKRNCRLTAQTHISQDIAAEILEKVKADSGEMPRYKLVCQATVGESNGQSMRLASRCLWDKDFDTCAETTWTNVRAPLAATELHQPPACGPMGSPAS